MPAELNMKTLSRYLEEIAIKRQIPTLMSGGPGVGKSMIVAQLAKKLGAVLCDIRLNLYDSVDMRGLPSIDGHKTVWHIPSTVPFVGNDNFPDDQLIILFLDELGSASMAVQPVAMQIINERAVGENKLKDNVVIISATNRVSDRGTSIVLPTTTLNRFNHVTAIADRECWQEWWLDQWQDPDQKKRAAVAVAYYEFRPMNFCTFDEAVKDRTTTAFATPRTNEQAWRLFMDETLDEDIRNHALAGAVGDGIAAEIIGFEKVWRKVLRTKDILNDPEGVQLPDEESMLYATAVSVSGDMTKKNVETLDRFIGRLPIMYQVLAWKLAMMRTNGTPDDVCQTRAAAQYSARTLSKVI